MKDVNAQKTLVVIVSYITIDTDVELIWMLLFAAKEEQGTLINEATR